MSHPGFWNTTLRNRLRGTGEGSVARSSSSRASSSSKCAPCSPSCRSTRPSGASGQHTTPGRERGVVGQRSEHHPDPADGRSRRPDHVSVRRLDLGRIPFQRPALLHGGGDRASMASFIASVDGQGLVTLDYGSGSPQEAAAFLAYLDAPVGNTTPIGMGEEWNDDEYLAASQLADGRLLGESPGLGAAGDDDGLNFLRIDHPAPFGISSSRSATRYTGAGRPTITVRAVTRANRTTRRPISRSPSSSPRTPRRSIRRSRSASTSANPRGGARTARSTTGPVRSSSSRPSRGSCPDSSATTVTCSPRGARATRICCSIPSRTRTPRTPTTPRLVRAGRRLSGPAPAIPRGRGQECPAARDRVQLGRSNPGKQTTSLVNGLFLADSLGALLDSPYDGADVWDLRNGWVTGNNDSSSLYGWRQGGDYGLIGSPSAVRPRRPAAPTSLPDVFRRRARVEDHPGRRQRRAGVQQRPEPDRLRRARAERPPRPDGHQQERDLRADRPVPDRQLPAFDPGPALAIRRGPGHRPEQISNGQSALANFATTLTLNGSTFSYSFPGTR